MERLRREPDPVVGLAIGVVVVVAVTLVLLPFRSEISRASPALVLVLPVVVAGVLGGRVAAVGTAVSGAVAFSVAFIPPVGSLRVAVSEDAVALVVFTMVAIAVGTLVASEGERRRAAEQRAAEIASMHERFQLLVAEQDRLREETERLAILERVGEQRAALLRSVSHDLRTPLATIRAVASDLRAGADFGAPLREELLGLVCDEAERLDRLVANLLSMSRIEAGALQPDRQAVALDELLTEVVKRLSRVFDGVTLVVDLAPGLPLLDIDYVQVDQVLTNLLENAARHSPPGATVRVLAGFAGGDRAGFAGGDRAGFAGGDRAARGGLVEVRVVDEGPGIDPDALEDIFEPFRTGRPSTSTGVGLAICRAIVDAHGGAISAANTAEGGACFVCTLPVRYG